MTNGYCLGCGTYRREYDFQREADCNPKAEVFVAGDVDVTSVKVRTPWGEVGATKVPLEEMDLDLERTIHADLTDEDE